MQSSETEGYRPSDDARMARNYEGCITVRWQRRIGHIPSKDFDLVSNQARFVYHCLVTESF